MFKFINNFILKHRIKNFSSTLTPATEGAKTEIELMPILHDIIEKVIDGNKGLSHEELNILLKYQFKKKELLTSHFKLNKNMVDTSLFVINGINLIFDKDGDSEDIIDMMITFSEVINNVRVSITISVHDLEEYITGFDPKQVGNYVKKVKR